MLRLSLITVLNNEHLTKLLDRDQNSRAGKASIEESAANKKASVELYRASQ